MLASLYRPSTVSNKSGVSYEASEARTNMTTFSRPISSTKPRLGLPLTILTAGFASGANLNSTRHPGAGSPGRYEWAPYATWSQSYLGKNVRVSSDKVNQDKIIEGADIPTRTTDDAVSLRVQLTDAHSRRLVLDDQCQPASEGLGRKILDRIAQCCWLVS